MTADRKPCQCCEDAAKICDKIAADYPDSSDSWDDGWTLAGAAAAERIRSSCRHASPVADAWIPVSERLPKTNSPVLVYQGDASHTKVTACYFFNEWSWTDNAYQHPCEPSHWMPLPAAPDLSTIAVPHGEKLTEPRESEGAAHAGTAPTWNGVERRAGGWDFAWLIEDVRSGQYYDGRGWTEDHADALRYSREADAMRAIIALPNGWHLIGKAVEHGWATAAPLAARDEGE